MLLVASTRHERSWLKQRLYLHTSCMHTLRYMPKCLCKYTEMCFQIHNKLILQTGYSSFDKLINESK
jgi:hypothetical protein